MSKEEKNIGIDNRGPGADEIAKAREQLARAKEQLQQAERVWEDDAFVEALAEKPQKEREEAFQKKLEIGTRILEIENAEIELVIKRVQTNSQQLESAIAHVRLALQRLSDVTRVLNATASLLAIVARIVAV